MKTDYDKIAQFKGSADLQVKAWDRFLSGWSENNQFSQEDETLRSQAQSQREQSKRTMQAAVQHQQNNQVVVSGSNTTGKTFKDCDLCPEMVMLPSGSFQMGGSASDEKPVHSVSVKAFAMGKTEVTQAEWQAVMGNNPSYFERCGASCPVENVGWDNAQEFINKLNAKTGKIYRLPSEAEWEYACRAGGNQSYCGSDNVDSVAVYSRNSGDKTQPVANKQANAWGLFDLSGNVWEWTQDCWHETYNLAPSNGDSWQSGECDQRVLRGGSYTDNPAHVRTARRIRIYTTFHGGNYGFRVARMLP